MPALYSAQAKFLSDKAMDSIINNNGIGLLRGCRAILRKYPSEIGAADATEEDIANAFVEQGFIEVSMETKNSWDEGYSQKLFARIITVRNHGDQGLSEGSDLYTGIQLLRMFGSRTDERYVRSNYFCSADFMADGHQPPDMASVMCNFGQSRGIVLREYGLRAGESQAAFQAAVKRYSL